MTPPSTLPGSAAGAMDNKGSRQAALLLHGIGNDDRKWLLGELATGQRTLLEGLLDELRALGVPPSPDLIDDMLVARPVPAQPAAAVAAADSGSPPVDAFAQRLSQVPSSDIAEILRNEPDALVARALRHAERTWGRKVIKQLSAARRHKIEELNRTHGPGIDSGSGRRLDDAILQGLATRAARRSAIRGGDIGDSAATRLADSFRRLTRRTEEDSLSRKSRP